MEYNPEVPSSATAAGQMSLMGSYNPTIGENIDRRISELEAEITRLKAVKATLPDGLISCHIQDLRLATNI